ncbi:MAG: anti-sigma regulatory factor [Roseiflexus sp.]|jgi:anti-sigma regulatory factor (Ser/Thr protein kinase)|nr:anti-sigma regulatory factor [Roseiflexus sp.]MBO9335234.1 anti-sigma regulatory factor [Roseiflexus sp.]MBO9365740.1 anti-sigma regulatory factor [Roseiflexus sp.]MBO9382446.1 anti-sigma regulatory factor [Roseiflexus sp.]MBO9390705.1 anti-sigma regulatory factor [Roseiflexus sp.]
MESVVCPVTREVDVYVAMGRARDMATALGFDDIDRTRIEIAVLELTRNILTHAGSGELAIELVKDGERRGIAIEARDQGPGIADITLALRDGYSTAQTLGAGLPGVRRLMDEFYIESTVGVGTRVRAVKWPGKRTSGPGKVRR